MRYLSYLFFFVLILLGISFAELNADPVYFNYYVGAHKISLSLLLVFSLGAGAFLGVLITLISILKLKTENHRLKKRVKHAEKEVNNLRTIPIKDKH